MKNTGLKTKSKSKENAIVVAISVCLIIGIIGSMVFCNEPIISFLFRPGILYALAIAFGLYLGFTYRP